MAVTNLGITSNPADNSAYFDGATPVVLSASAVGSWLPNDLAIGLSVERDFGGGIAHTISQAGGQSWTSRTQNGSGTTAIITTRLFDALFDGTWDADPSIASNKTSEFDELSAFLLGFRPSDPSNTWQVDVAESWNAYAAPSGPPYDVAITGQTSVSGSGFFLAIWGVSHNNCTWALQTPGWNALGSPAYFRNTANAHVSIAMAWKPFSSVGEASGSVTNRQSEASQGFTSIVTFAEVVTAGPPLSVARQIAMSQPNVLLRR